MAYCQWLTGLTCANSYQQLWVFSSGTKLSLAVATASTTVNHSMTWHPGPTRWASRRRSSSSWFDVENRHRASLNFKRRGRHCASLKSQLKDCGWAQKVTVVPRDEKRLGDPDRLRSYRWKLYRIRLQLKRTRLQWNRKMCFFSPAKLGPLFLVLAKVRLLLVVQKIELLLYHAGFLFCCIHLGESADVVYHWNLVVAL